MSNFFTQKHCDRCGASLASGRIMSMLNTDCICMKCKDAERQHPEYERAREREREEVRKGNRNYEGLLKGKEIGRILKERLNI